MWFALFILFQIFLWVVVGGFLAIIVIAPILILLGLLELIGALTVNNILRLIRKIPILGLIFTGVVSTGIGVVMIVFGLWVWVNYLFIALRCIGGPKI